MGGRDDPCVCVVCVCVCVCVCTVLLFYSFIETPRKIETEKRTISGEDPKI